MLSVAEVEAREAWGGFLEHPDIPYHKQAHSSKKKPGAKLRWLSSICNIFSIYILLARAQMDNLAGSKEQKNNNFDRDLNPDHPNGFWVVYS